MYFTRKTETVLAVIATCAGKSGHSLALQDITEPGNGNAEELAECVSLLLRHGVFKARSGGRVTLAVDPATMTLGAILRVTQPELARPQSRPIHGMGRNVFTLAVEAASSNFLSIADKFTLADFIADHTSRDCSARYGAFRPGHGVRSTPHGNVGTQ